MKLKRYDIKSLYRNPSLRRWLLCNGTVVAMARENIEVSLDVVLEMYDKFQSKGLKLPDGYYYES